MGVPARPQARAHLIDRTRPTPGWSAACAWLQQHCWSP